MATRHTRHRRRTRPAGNGNARQTRDAILCAARQTFAEQGYDHAGLREIAARAGIDKRLITRYFGSKQQLFAEALRASVEKFRVRDPAEYLRFGEQIARRLFGKSDLSQRDRLEFISSCVYSASSPTGRTLIRANVKQQIEEIAADLSGRDPALRATLMLSVAMGLSLLREVLEIEPLAGLNVRRALTYVAPLLQQSLDGRAAGTRHGAGASGAHVSER